MNAASFLAALVDPSWLRDSLMQNPFAFFAWSVLCFAAGAWARSAVAAAKGPHPSRRRVRGFSPNEARAALASLDSPGMVPVGEFEGDVYVSAKSGSGVFVAQGIGMHGVEGPLESFRLADEWRRFLSRPRNRRLLEKVAET